MGVLDARMLAWRGTIFLDITHGLKGERQLKRVGHHLLLLIAFDYFRGLCLDLRQTCWDGVVS
jgi:hypothetical protein